jgi:hypothetical protein
MGFGFRVFLIDEEDKIIRIPTSRFDKIRNRDSKEALIQYKDSRIRYAMVGGILQKIITEVLRLRYIGNTCGIIEKEIPEEITYEEERS